MTRQREINRLDNGPVIPTEINVRQYYIEQIRIFLDLFEREIDKLQYLPPSLAALWKSLLAKARTDLNANPFLGWHFDKLRQLIAASRMQLSIAFIKTDTPPAENKLARLGFSNIFTTLLYNTSYMNSYVKDNSMTWSVDETLIIEGVQSLSHHLFPSLSKEFAEFFEHRVFCEWELKEQLLKRKDSKEGDELEKLKKQLEKEEEISNSGLIALNPCHHPLTREFYRILVLNLPGLSAEQRAYFERPIVKCNLAGFLSELSPSKISFEMQGQGIVMLLNQKKIKYISSTRSANMSLFYNALSSRSEEPLENVIKSCVSDAEQDQLQQTNQQSSPQIYMYPRTLNYNPGLIIFSNFVLRVCKNHAMVEYYHKLDLANPIFTLGVEIKGAAIPIHTMHHLLPLDLTDIYALSGADVVVPSRNNRFEIEGMRVLSIMLFMFAMAGSIPENLPPLLKMSERLTIDQLLDAVVDSFNPDPKTRHMEELPVAGGGASADDGNEAQELLQKPHF